MQKTLTTNSGRLTHSVLTAAVIVAGMAVLAAQQSKYPQLPSETPAKLQRPTEDFDHDRRDVMIPMRDGVKLHRVFLGPKGAPPAPLFRPRPPYAAPALTLHAPG